VRPTDENQAGSRRPNLMSSSRRASAEINILAMLDGQTGKRRRFTGLSRAMWYGGAGVLACALLGAAAWMVHDQAGGGFEGRVSTGPAVVPLEIASETLPNPALPVEPAPAHGAAIVDVAAPDGVATADIPPPRFRPDEHELREAHHHPPARPVIAAATPAAPPAPPVQPAVIAARPAVHHAPKAASRPAAKAVPRVAALPAHPRRASAPAKPRPAQTVDTDVALISAIIQHVNKRGELKDGADCGDKPCAPKLPTRP